MLSDGECAEGSVWEAFRFIADLPIPNIRVYVVANGYGGYGSIPAIPLVRRLRAFLQDNLIVFQLSQKTVEQFPFLRGLNAHYHKMSEADYKLAMEILA
jgi:hypothetical protein